MKKRLNDPILQNTRKLILSVNKQENYSYDEEFVKKGNELSEDSQPVDISTIDVLTVLNKEF